MSNRTHTAIACLSPRGVIGLAGQLPWDLPEDLEFFREFTMGQQVVMGRKTVESLRKPLDGREVITFSMASPEWPAMRPDAIIAGGAQTYQFFMPVTKTLILTHITSGLREDTWKNVVKFPMPARNSYTYRLLTGKMASKTGIEYYRAEYTLTDPQA